jgi:hypothetical protein
MRVIFETPANDELIGDLADLLNAAMSEEVLEEILDAFDYPVVDHQRSPELQRRIVEHMIEASGQPDGSCLIDIPLNSPYGHSQADIDALLNAAYEAGATSIVIGHQNSTGDKLEFLEDCVRYDEIVINGKNVTPFTGIVRLNDPEMALSMRIIDSLEEIYLSNIPEANRLLSRVMDQVKDMAAAKRQREPSYGP